MSIIISILFSLLHPNTHDIHDNHHLECLTDEFYPEITDEELTNLINRRNNIRASLNNILQKKALDTLYVPVVFHNLYKMSADGIPINSYCDYGYDVAINDEDKCSERMWKTLEILNGQFLPAKIQFILHPDYPEMLHDTDEGYDGFYEDATGGNSTFPSPNSIKNYYNVSNALNIYTHECLPSSNAACNASKYGFSTYPWSLDNNEPGVFIKHQSLPGSVDTYSPAGNSQVGILAHEISHFFSILHINGTWFLNTNTQRELVSGQNCNYSGDSICDTPASPGYVPLINDEVQAWYYDSNNRECIYHGYGGNYDPNTDILSIGGHNKSFDQGAYPNHNYCDKWGFEDPYGLENCERFTNYDDLGYFFGTRNLSQQCFNSDLSEYATECNIDNYTYLPIGNNFMQAGTTTLNYCSPRPMGHNDYDENDHGFTSEQFENIRYSIENDYIGCNIITACNYNSLSLYNNNLCRYPCSVSDGCLTTDDEYNSNHNLYNCEGLCINDIDEDNICDHLEVVGCQNQGACNYDVRATDPGTCEYFNITGIYPNPFNPINHLFTIIRYHLCQEADVEISVYDIHGRRLTILANESHSEGYHSIKWDASKLSSGIYFLNMSSGKIFVTKKLALIK